MSAESVPPAAAQPSVPVERVGRGALAALVVIPVGVLAWVVVWSLGYIAAIVGAVVAFGAFWLYVRGAGRISRVGALVVLGITVVTLLLAFFAGIVLDVARGFGEGSGLGTWGAFTHDQFWPSFWELFPDILPEYKGDFAWAIGFGALGSFATLRTAFAAASGGTPAGTVAAGTVPAAGTPAADAPVLAPEGAAPAVAYAPAAAPEAPVEPVAAAQPEPGQEPDVADEAPAR